MRRLVTSLWCVLTHSKCTSDIRGAYLLLLSILTDFRRAFWKSHATARLVCCAFLLTLDILEPALLRARLVKVYWSCVEPYCSSSPSHRWSLERILGGSALLRACDGHLITWLTEVICHLHPTGASARSWPPLPVSAPTTSQRKFMHVVLVALKLQNLWDNDQLPARQSIETCNLTTEQM